LLSVDWWDTQQGFYSQVGVAFFSPLFLFLTRRLTALLACFLLQKNDAFFLWFKYERGFFAQLLRMAAQFSGKSMLGLLQNEAKKSQVLGGVHEHLTSDIIGFVSLLSPPFNT
jgi:hypothetical protein